MDRGVAVLLTAGVGGLVAIQAPINSGLGKQVGGYQAALISFMTGTLLLCLITALSKGGLGAVGDVRNITSWHYLLGGVLGAAYVSTVLVTVRTLGAGGLTAATVTGQLSASMLVDHFGLLGVEKSPVTAVRLLGVLLLALGTYLVVRD